MKFLFPKIFEKNLEILRRRTVVQFWKTPLEKTFRTCVDLFLGRNWTGANFCLSELHYRVIRESFKIVPTWDVLLFGFRVEKGKISDKKVFCSDVQGCYHMLIPGPNRAEFLGGLPT